MEEEEWSREKLGDDERYSNDVKLIVNDKEILLHQRAVDCPNATGNTVWDSGVLLSRFLEYHTLQLNSKWSVVGKKCLELGSGTGIVGISAALLGAKLVLVTDKYNVDLLQLNAQTNWQTHKHHFPPSNQLMAMEYTWGDGGKGYEEVQAKCKGGWELVLVADFLYDYRAVKHLIRSLLLFSTPLHTHILLAYQIHDEESNEELWDEGEGIAKYFQVEKIDYSLLPPSYRPSDHRIHFLHLLRKPKY